jgi:hypothetical protein
MKILFHAYDYPKLETKLTSKDGVIELLAKIGVEADMVYEINKDTGEYIANGWVINAEYLDKFLKEYQSE